jgi:hypothetical protein
MSKLYFPENRLCKYFDSVSYQEIVSTPLLIRGTD